MADDDKNQHLSSILDNIKDYGPDGVDDTGEPAGAGEDVDLFMHNDTPGTDGFEDLGDDSAAENSPPAADFQDTNTTTSVAAASAAETGAVAGARPGRYIAATAIGLLLLAVVVAFIAYRLQSQIMLLQQQVDKLAAQQQPRSPYADEHSHNADPQLAELQQAIAELQAQIAQLQSTGVDSGPVGKQVSTAATAPAKSTGTDKRTSEAAASAKALAKPVDKATPGAQATAAPVLGPWFVNLGSFEKESRARSWAAQIKDPPRPPQVTRITSETGVLYRVRIGGFANRAEARKAADRLKNQWQLDAVWISDK